MDGILGFDTERAYIDFCLYIGGKVTKRSSQIDEQMGHHLNQPAATRLLISLKRKAKRKGLVLHRYFCILILLFQSDNILDSKNFLNYN